MTNQLVSIKRPDPGLSAVFEDMYINERLVDVTLSCCDGQLQAHKLVLAASSSYFSNLFDKLANPFHYPVIVIKDMNIEDLRLIVEFMYKGQLTLSQEKLMNLVRSAENLEITGLTSNATLMAGNVESRNGISSNGLNNGHKSTNFKTKKGKKSFNHQQQIMFARTYQQSRHEGISIQADKLLEQSMITGESLDSNNHNHHFPYNATNDPTSTKNLDNQHLHTPSPSSINISQQHISNNSGPQQQSLANQFVGQVLSHSLAANRTSSLVQATTNELQNNNHLVPQQVRGRVHPCNICWKTFREKANLKRHLQVHSLDRIVYACPDCNKTFAWKDNYIRHTKTAHHMSNARPQT